MRSNLSYIRVDLNSFPAEPLTYMLPSATSQSSMRPTGLWGLVQQ